MENDDEHTPKGLGRFLAVMVGVVLLASFCIAFKREADAVDAAKQASEERMYIACLDKLVNPEHANYAAQLSTCKVVK